MLAFCGYMRYHNLAPRKRRKTQERRGENLTLKERRTAANLRQSEVAEALEVDQTAVSRWESGENKPLPKYQRKLAALYGCTVDELMEEKE